jgi:hypothetical protein
MLKGLWLTALLALAIFGIFGTILYLLGSLT